MHPCARHQAVQRPFTNCSTAATRKPRLSVRARTSDYDRLKGIEDSLASEFSAHINELCLKAPLQHRRPSPLDPPTAAVAAQLDALQINDWPEPDAGVYTAMAFAKPYNCEQLPAVTAQQHTSNLQHSQQQRQRSGTPGHPPGTPKVQDNSAEGALKSETETESEAKTLSHPPATPKVHDNSAEGGAHASEVESETKTQSHSPATPKPQDNSAEGAHESEAESETETKSERDELRVRSWGAREQWLTPDEFVEQMHSAPYDVLLGCDSWRACSSMVFPATRAGQRAVQAVEVLATPRQQIPGNWSSTGTGTGAHNGSGNSSSSSSGNSSSSSSSSGNRDARVVTALQKYTFTFCLELIGVGPYKGCWMTVGVRPGNYSV